MTSMLKTLVMMTWYPEERADIAFEDEDGPPDYLLTDGLRFICEGTDELFKREALWQLVRIDSPKVIEAIAVETLRGAAEEWTRQFHQLGDRWICEISKHEACDAMLRVFDELKRWDSPLRWHLAVKLLRWDHTRLASLLDEKPSTELVRFGRELVNWLRSVEFRICTPFDWIPVFISRLMPQLKPNLTSALKGLHQHTAVELLLQIGIALDPEWDDKILSCLDQESCTAFPELVLSFRHRNLAWVKEVMGRLLQQGQCPPVLLDSLELCMLDANWLTYLDQCREVEIIKKLAMLVEMLLIDPQPLPFIAEHLLPWLQSRLSDFDDDVVILMARTVAFTTTAPPEMQHLPFTRESARIRFVFYEELADWRTVDESIHQLVQLQYYLSVGLFEKSKNLWGDESAFAYCPWYSTDADYLLGLSREAVRLLCPQALTNIVMTATKLDALSCLLFLFESSIGLIPTKLFDTVCLRLLHLTFKRRIHAPEAAVLRLFEVYLQSSIPNQYPCVIVATLTVDSSRFIPSLLASGRTEVALLITAAHPSWETLNLIWPHVLRKLNLNLNFTPNRLPCKLVSDDALCASLHLITALSPNDVDSVVFSLRQDVVRWPVFLEHLPWEMAWNLPNKLMF